MAYPLQLRLADRIRRYRRCVRPSWGYNCALTNSRLLDPWSDLWHPTLGFMLAGTVPTARWLLAHPCFEPDWSRVTSTGGVPLVIVLDHVVAGSSKWPVSRSRRERRDDAKTRPQ
jgi:hypothetical protein